MYCAGKAPLYCYYFVHYTFRGQFAFNQENQMKCRIIAAALLAATVIISVAYSEVGFRDVLDTPALKTPVASKTLYTGKSWIQATVPVSSDLTAVNFPTPKQGWAVGHDGVVLHTSDSGATWSRQLDGKAAAELMKRYYAEHPVTDVRLSEEINWLVSKGADQSLLSVWFENETTGFIVGVFNLIFRTDDGGKSWEPWLHRTENPRSLHFYAIKPIGQDIYACGEQGMALKFDRKTERFRALKIDYNGTLFGITGKPGALIVHGMRGNVFRSRDGGARWQKIETGLPLTMSGSTVTEDGKIVLASQAGYLLVSADDGAGFSLIKLEKPFPTEAVVALDKQTVILAGLFGMRAQELK
jgi:photosystem II stability/assembly factor-like uncharacterized protein